MIFYVAVVLLWLSRSVLTVRHNSVAVLHGDFFATKAL